MGLMQYVLAICSFPRCRGQCEIATQMRRMDRNSCIFFLSCIYDHRLFSPSARYLDRIRWTPSSRFQIILNPLPKMAMLVAMMASSLLKFYSPSWKSGSLHINGLVPTTVFLTVRPISNKKHEQFQAGATTGCQSGGTISSSQQTPIGTSIVAQICSLDATTTSSMA